MKEAANWAASKHCATTFKLAPMCDVALTLYDLGRHYEADGQRDSHYPNFEPHWRSSLGLLICNAHRRIEFHFTNLQGALRALNSNPATVIFKTGH
jgi:hypothetical protein